MNSLTWLPTVAKCELLGDLLSDVDFGYGGRSKTDRVEDFYWLSLID